MQVCVYVCVCVLFMTVRMHIDGRVSGCCDLVRVGRQACLVLFHWREKYAIQDDIAIQQFSDMILGMQYAERKTMYVVSTNI